MVKVRQLLGTVGLLVLLIAMIIIAVFSSLRTPDDVAISECRAWYGRAKSAAESSAIDARRPITSRAQASAASDCRTLRLGGKLGER